MARERLTAVQYDCLGCVVYVDRRRRLSLEHYQNDGLLDRVIEGKQAAELYIPAIEQGLVSRLDHAAYLGRELARAEHALRSDTPYVQDAAPASLSNAAEPHPAEVTESSEEDKIGARRG